MTNDELLVGLRIEQRRTFGERVIAYLPRIIAGLTAGPSAYWVLAIGRQESDFKRFDGADKLSNPQQAWGLFQILPSPGMTVDPWDITQAAGWTQRHFDRNGGAANPHAALSIRAFGVAGAQRRGAATAYIRRVEGYMRWAQAVASIWTPPVIVRGMRENNVLREVPGPGEPVQLPRAAALEAVAVRILAAGWPRPETARPAARQVLENGRRGTHLAGLALDILVGRTDGRPLANWFARHPEIGFTYITYHGAQIIGTRQGVGVGSARTLTFDDTADHNDHIHVEWDPSVRSVNPTAMARLLDSIERIPVR